jgi:pimeloyl-ACP methyl ester carboxylesterase
MPLTTTPPRLYFEVRGDGEPLLVMVGFAVSCAVMEPLAELYATRLQCITYDHPGTGRSSRRPVPYTTAHLAASAIRLLDELGIEAAHVAGLSMGGIVAQELALRFPHRVRGLILVSTSTSGPLSTPPDLRRIAAAAPRMVGGSLLRRRPWLAPALFSPAFVARDPDRADALLRPMTAHLSAWGTLGQLCAASLHDRALDLHRIRAPTLVLHGDRDVLVPVSNARLLAAGIPDAELRVFPGAGHGVALEHAEETFSLMCEWLARRRPAAGKPPSRAASGAERLSRRLAVPIGGFRVGRSSAVRVSRVIAAPFAARRRAE